MDLLLTGEPMTDFRLDWQWQEELHYREGDRRLVLHCGWGVSPPVVFVPSASRWDATMPDWLHGRRDEIVRRIEENSDHVVASADWAYGGHGCRPQQVWGRWHRCWRQSVWTPTPRRSTRRWSTAHRGRWRRSAGS